MSEVVVENKVVTFEKEFKFEEGKFIMNMKVQVDPNKDGDPLIINENKTIIDMAEVPDEVLSAIKNWKK